jgi:micrococcal nuclease
MKSTGKIAYVIALGIVAIIASSKHFIHKSDNVPRGFDKIQHNVVRVIDGDTIELSGGERIRYIGIDTPEVRKKTGSGWVYDPMPYAEEASLYNKKLVEGKEVRLEFDAEKKDRYNRLLAYVYVGGTMVNLELIKHGYAMLYTRPPNIKYVEKFIEAQKFAREHKNGIWGYFDLKENKISSSDAKHNIGKMKTVEGMVKDTYMTDKVLILNFKGKFKVAMFKNKALSLPKEAMRSPDMYFKGKTVRVYGIIKEYKGSPEIVINDLSQLEIVD